MASGKSIQKKLERRAGAGGAWRKPMSVKSAYAEAVAFLGSKNSRKIAGNTVLVRGSSVHGPEAAILADYHGSTVAEYRPGSIRLSSHGYRTYTTKERINWFLPEGYALAQEQNEWFVYGPNHWRKRFSDGMLLEG